MVDMMDTDKGEQRPGEFVVLKREEGEALSETESG